MFTQDDRSYYESTVILSRNVSTRLILAATFVGLAVTTGTQARGQCEPQAQACFQGIGDLDGGRFHSEAYGVARSATGEVVVVGSSSSTASAATCGGSGCREAVVFYDQSLHRVLTHAPSQFVSHARDVTIVGSSIILVGDSRRSTATGTAFRASIALSQLSSTLVAPDFFLGPGSGSIARSISEDGTVVVGTHGVNGEDRAFAWEESGGTSTIIVLGGNFKPSNEGYGVSPGGGSVVGRSSNSSGFFEAFIMPENLCCFIFDPGNPCCTNPISSQCCRTGIGDLSGGVFFSQAHAVARGVVVGESQSSSGLEAFRSTPPGFFGSPRSMTGLGDLAGGAFKSSAMDISANARMVVGYGTNAKGQRAFLWHSSIGMRDLKEFLVNEQCVSGLDDWTLFRATGISDDGLAIVGLGRNPQGQSEGWVLTLPDCDGNGNWDGLENSGIDCNDNCVADDCELQFAVSEDCNENEIPDVCDILIGDGGLCDLAVRNDCNRDCDSDGIPEECKARDVLDRLAGQGASAQIFAQAREDPNVTPGVTFGTMIQAYGRPWRPGTNQTPGGAGGSCTGAGDDGTAPQPAERLRVLSSIRDNLPFDLALRVIEELHDFEMLLGNEAFADAMDATVGDQDIPLEQIPDLFAFQGLPGISSLLAEELAALRGREITIPTSLADPFNDDTSIDGNYPQFGTVRAPVYNRMRPNAEGTFGGPLAYRSNYGFGATTDNETAATTFPQGHGDALGYYLTAMKVFLDAFGADGPASGNDAFALQLIQAQAPHNGVCDPNNPSCTTDCECITDDDGVHHHVAAKGVRAMAAAMAARARTLLRIVNLTFRRDYRQDADTPLVDSDADRGWNMADWARRGATGAYLDWAVLNHLLPVPTDPADTTVEAVHRQSVEAVNALASTAAEMQDLVDGAGSGFDPLGLMPNVVPFRIIQPGGLLNFLEGGDPSRSHYGIVRAAAVEAIDNARGILRRASLADNRLRNNQDAFTNFENQVRDSDVALTNRLIEVFGLPSPSDPSDNDFDPATDDACEAGVTAGCPGGPDLRNFLLDSEGTTEVEWLPRTAPGEIQLAMFELRTATLKVQIAEEEVAQLEALIDAKANNVAEIRNEAVEELEIRADACNDQIRIVDRRETMSQQREFLGSLGRFAGLFTAAAGCAVGVGPACAIAGGMVLKTAGDILKIGASELLDTGGDNEFDLKREELRINCWQTAQLTRISNDQQIRGLEIDLENLLRETPQSLLNLAIAHNQTQQALGVVNKTFQEGIRLIDDRTRIRRVQVNRLLTFRWQDMAFRTFRNQSLEQYGAFFDLAARYVMLATRAFAYEHNERTFADEQVRDVYRERLVGFDSASATCTDRGLQSILACLDQARDEGAFNARMQKLSQFDPDGDVFSIRRNLLGLGINPTDNFQQQLAKNREFRAFLESHIVQDLRDVPAFRQLASLDSSRDAGPAIVLTFGTEVAAQNFFGQPRSFRFGAPANFDACSNPKIFEYAVLLERVNASALGVNPGQELIFAHFLPVGTSVQREPVVFPKDCIQRPARSWAVVDQRIPGVSPAYRTAGNEILDDFDIPRLATARDLNVVNRFPVSHAQVRNTGTPRFRDSLAGWSAWNTQWLLAIPGRQFTDTDDAATVREKLLILIYDATFGPDGQPNPRDPDENLGIDDIKLRIKAYGKP